MIVAAYGVLIPEEILKIFPLGCVNIHASLLPKWRGPSPIQYCILNNDKKSGITIIKMNNKIDQGEILYQRSCQISEKETSYSLQKKLEKISFKGIEFILKSLVKEKKINCKKQNIKLATYSKKILKKEGLINWNLSASKIERKIRAFNPWPTSFFLFNKKIIKIWDATIIFSNKKNEQPGKILKISKTGIEVATKKNILNIKKIQIEGKKIISIRDLLNSNKKTFSEGIILQNQIKK